MKLFILLMIVIANQTEVEAGELADGYQPRGAALELFYDKSPEVLMSGPAGTGKSRGLLEKLHLCAMKYPRMRGLIVRKTRASLTESGLVTFEDKVLSAGSRIKRGAQRRYRHSYQYANGSEIVIAGMDNPVRVMSTEFDMVMLMEATELAEEDWENLSTRLRNGKMPYQQLIADCNPGSPSHWLKKRCERDATVMKESRHEDNPTLFDAVGRVTLYGEAYLSKLNNLTGVRKLRLRDGIWAMAEGMVYADVWDPRLHLIDRFDVPKDWLRLWVVDFGFTNPFCWQCWAIDPDGRMSRMAEIYRTKRLVEDHARDIKAWLAASGEPWPFAIVCDHDAEDRATLERHLGCTTEPANKAVSEGIQLTAGRMKLADDKKPRLQLLRDSLIEVEGLPIRDADLEEGKKPTCTEEEVEGYVWADGSGGKKEQPVKRDDHGCDAMRYAVAYVETQFSQGVF